MRVFTALENAQDIQKAITVWERKFGENAQRIKWAGGTVLFHERYSLWGLINKNSIVGKSPGHFWHPFGRVKQAFRKNIIVEINPPASGINTNVQAVIARDDKGARWLLHQGHVHMLGRHVNGPMFGMVTESTAYEVLFSSGKAARYYLVANLDASTKTLQEQVNTFVFECEKVRAHYASKKNYSTGKKELERKEKLESAETKSFPELRGAYEVGAQEAKNVLREHGEVWHALTQTLNRLRVKHSNGRVGRLGPDLRTFGSKRILFEIKSKNLAADIQQGTGQLFIYENLLEAPHTKVLVLPELPANRIQKVLESLKIETLVYSRKNKTIHFDETLIKALLK